MAPGVLAAVAGERCWALVGASPDSPPVAWLWRQLGQGTGPAALLAGLLGAGFDGARDFALLAAAEVPAQGPSEGPSDGPAEDPAEGGYRLFCRGGVTATVYDGSGSGSGARIIDGGAMLTWREHVVPASAERIVLGTPPPDGAPRLPAAAGVVLAGCVIIDLTQHAVTGAVARDTAPYGASRPDGLPGLDAMAQLTSLNGKAERNGAAGGGASPLADTRPDAVGRQAQAGVPGTTTVTSQASVRQEPDAAGPGGEAPGGEAPGEDAYDYLWGATSARSVEDAAVRPEAESAIPGGVPAPPPPPASLPSPGSPSPPLSSPSALPATPLATHPVPPPPPPPSAPGPPPGLGATGGLIDAVPWGPPPAVVQPVGNGQDAGRLDPDDAGHTVKRSDLGRHAARTAPPDQIGPAVPALICPAGHVNPPSEATCRACGAALPQDPVVVPRPVLGVLRLSTGDVISLDRDVVMGRSPRADAVGADGEERPHVVKLPSADGDISRTHLRVALDGWHVLVTDLHSTNGTLVALPGREPEMLRPGEPLLIKAGTVVTLADGIDFRYEVSE